MANDASAERVLVVAPIGRDAAAIAERLTEHGYLVQVCSGAAEAAGQAASGAGAVLLTEEALEREHLSALLAQLGAQPAWSELPVIILTTGGESRFAQLLDLAAEAAGSITLLERPLGAATLLRSIEVALRSRRRQYQVRDLLQAQTAREAALREADRRKDTFLAILSHELRNPLAPIRNAVELLGSAKLTTMQLGWAQNVIRRQITHMASLLDDLLDLARITQGKLRLRRERCSLRGVIDAAVETARPIVDSKRHELIVQVAEEATFLADPLRLAQAISNLLTNAAKYTDAGGHIELRARVDGMLTITVKDDGVGIPPGELGQLFTMFSQIASGGRTDGGLGIGLALVKGFVELHQGTVEARSAGVGRGSEFIVRLPLTPVPAVDAGSAEANAATSPSGRLRVLIADDNNDAADSLALLLSLDGHEVRTVYRGDAAVSTARTFRPDVALLDIGMPELDGYAVGSAIRQQRGGREICLIALTGLGQEDDIRRSRDAGFAMHMTKPIEPDRLRAVLGRLQDGKSTH